MNTAGDSRFRGNDKVIIAGDSRFHGNDKLNTAGDSRFHGNDKVNTAGDSRFHGNDKLNTANDTAFYSAQTGKLLKGSEQNPELVIWAVGRSRMSLCSAPPQNWKPLYVLDLNYTEDSPGREYAVKTKAQYLSGWLWFKTQAQAQRVLFEKLSMQ